MHIYIYIWQCLFCFGSLQRDKLQVAMWSEALTRLERAWARMAIRLATGSNNQTIKRFAELGSAERSFCSPQSSPSAYSKQALPSRRIQSPCRTPKQAVLITLNACYTISQSPQSDNASSSSKGEAATAVSASAAARQTSLAATAV